MAETQFMRYVKTTSLCCAFVCLGLMLSVIGPSMLEIQCAVGLSYNDVIKILPARSSGWVFGSLIVGVLHKHLNPIVSVAFCLAISGIGGILIPWTNSLVTMLAVTFIGHIGCGMMDNTANVLILYMWGQDSQPYMQALHFCFGLGSLIMPLVVSPFLSGGEVPIEGLESNVTEIGTECVPENLRIHIPFAMLGSCCLLMSAVFVYLSINHRQTDEHPSRLSKAEDSVTGLKKDLIWTKRIAILLAGLFLFTLLGFEVGMGSFITSFAVMSNHHLTKQVGAYMTSLYFFTYTFFRLFAIGFVKKISIYLNITVELSILVIANIFLVPFGNSVEWCLWVGVALAGMGISTVWAATFSLLESCFPVTSGVASLLSVCACAGEWVYPVIMGYAIQYTPQLFLYVILICTVLCCSLFAILTFVCKTRLTKTSVGNNNVKDGVIQASSH